MRIALFLSALLLSQPALAHRWIEMGASEGFTSYLDANTMSREGDIAEAWALAEQAVVPDAGQAPDRSIRAYHLVARLRFDCNARRYAVLSMTTYASTSYGMSLQDRVAYEAPGLAPLYEGTDNEMQWRFACGYTKADPWALEMARTHERVPGAGTTIASPVGGFMAALSQQQQLRELPLADGSAKVTATTGTQLSGGGKPVRVFAPDSVVVATAVLVPELPGPVTIAAHWFNATSGEALATGHQHRLLDDAPLTESFALQPTPEWTPGLYRVEIRVNGVTATTVPFEVRATKH